jgi:hypothetical protein
MTAPDLDPGFESKKRPIVLLSIGATIGLVLAAWGVLENVQSRSLPANSVARVNGALIRAENFERLVEAVMGDMRTPDRETASQRVIERMIDEELLVQRALDLGLVHLDRKVRSDLTSSVINSVVSEVANDEPSENELRAFYGENQSYFTQPGRMRLDQIFFRQALSAQGVPDGQPLDGAARAEQARAELAGGADWKQIKATWGEAVYAPLPDAMLPGQKIREYLGPTVLKASLDLEVEQISAVVRSGTGFHIVLLVDREAARIPAFEEVAKQVKVDWRRRRGDDALRDYLADLRAVADIEIAPELRVSAGGE